MPVEHPVTAALACHLARKSHCVDPVLVLAACADDSLRQVPAAAGSSGLRIDAAVNAANTLCSLAELCAGSEVLNLLTQAVQLYQSALAQEEDAAVSTMLSGLNRLRHSQLGFSTSGLA